MSDHDPQSTPSPHLRASDAEREHAAERLRQATGDGRLTVEELDERLEAVYAARLQAELEPLTADLPDEPAGREPAAGARRVRRVPVRAGEGGTSWIVSVMGGNDRKGRWRIGRACRVVNVMGGSNLDLNDAELAAGEVTMTVVSVMGGSDIYVPEGMNVEVTKIGIMGGNDVDLGDDRPDPGGPVLRLRLISIMGGTDVSRGRPRSRRQRREELREQRQLDRTERHDRHHDEDR
ncbi:MAG TPA: DUF1707 domain-containing protein [Conexibacter sp.]|jgi:hypothetical protein